MRLVDYIPHGQRSDFAKSVGIAVCYLSQICQGTRRPEADLAVRISAETGGQVSVEELRPLKSGDPYPLAARLRASDPIKTPEEIRKEAIRLLQQAQEMAS
jgi:DNA-binding transcriptional regulator YdaS (Cro superfamily)